MLIVHTHTHTLINTRDSPRPLRGGLQYCGGHSWTVSGYGHVNSSPHIEKWQTEWHVPKLTYNYLMTCSKCFHAKAVLASDADVTRRKRSGSLTRLMVLQHRGFTPLCIAVPCDIHLDNIPQYCSNRTSDVQYTFLCSWHIILGTYMYHHKLHKFNLFEFLLQSVKRPV